MIIHLTKGILNMDAVQLNALGEQKIQIYYFPVM